MVKNNSFRVCATVLVFLFLLPYAAAYAQNTENEVSRYSKFRIPSEHFSGFKLTSVTHEFYSIGVKSNPGIGTNDYLKSISCIDCLIEAVEEVYFEFYESEEDREIDLGILVKKYRSQKELQADILEMKLSDNTIYFQDNNYLILFWSDETDEEMQQEHFDIIVNHYRGKGILMLKEQQLKDSEFDLIDFSDSNYVKEKKVSVSGERRVKYLFYADGGFLAFYDDGTVTVCGDCVLCADVVKKVSGEKPFSIYQMNNERIMVHSPDVDVNTPFFIELHDNSEEKEWYIIDYKEVLPIPSDCQRDIITNIKN